MIGANPGLSQMAVAKRLGSQPAPGGRHLLDNFYTLIVSLLEDRPRTGAPSTPCT